MKFEISQAAARYAAEKKGRGPSNARSSAGSCSRRSRLQHMTEVVTESVDEKAYRPTMSIDGIYDVLRPHFKLLDQVRTEDVYRAIALVTSAYFSDPVISYEALQELLDHIDDADDDEAFVLMLGMYGLAIRHYKLLKAAPPVGKDWHEHHIRHYKRASWWADAFMAVFATRRKLWEHSLIIRKATGS